MFNPLNFYFIEKPYNEHDQYNFNNFTRYIKKFKLGDIELEYILVQTKETKKWSLFIEILENIQNNKIIEKFISDFRNWSYLDSNEWSVDKIFYIFNNLNIKDNAFAVALFSSFDKNLLF